MQLVCKHCGKKFRGRANRKFCSKNCASKNTYNKPKYNFETKRIAVNITNADRDYITKENVNYGYIFSLGIQTYRLKEFKKQNLKLVPLWIAFLLFGGFCIALTPYINTIDLRVLFVTLGTILSIVGIISLSFGLVIIPAIIYFLTRLPHIKQ